MDDESVHLAILYIYQFFCSRQVMDTCPLILQPTFSIAEIIVILGSTYTEYVVLNYVFNNVSYVY